MVGKKGRTPSRRDFLGLGWRILGALVVGEGAYLGLRFLASRRPESSAGQIVTAGMITDFSPGTITPFDTARFFLIRFEDGGFLALHTKCTHLACVVAWNKSHRQFECPCHGSVFNQDGTVAHPPAPRPLDRFPVTIADDGRIEVDTSKRIVRSAPNPAELVYAPAQLVSSPAPLNKDSNNTSTVK